MPQILSSPYIDSSRFFSRKVCNVLSMINGERVFDRNQGASVMTRRGVEGAIEVDRDSHFKGLNLNPQYLSRWLRLLKDKRGIRIGRIPEDGGTRERPGQNLFQ